MGILLGVGVFLLFNGRTTPMNQLSQQEGDTVFLMRKDKSYEMNIATKALKPYASPIDGIDAFTGLPKKVSSKQVIVAMGKVLLSADKTKAIVVFYTFDNTKEPSGFDGSLPTIGADEFICDIAVKECVPTDALALAYKASGETREWFKNDMLWWYQWDSARNLLFGHLTGEGVGNASPVYIFNLNSKTIQQTTGYNSLNDKEKRAEVPSGAFSPSLNKFVMVYETKDAWNLLLYESSDLTAPRKEYDISLMNDATHGFNRIGSVAWSADEKTLILLTNNQIFTLNLESRERTLRYTDTSQDVSGLQLDFNAVRLSPSERYIVFVDYDKRTTPLEENKMNSVLKAIDLQYKNKTTELLREQGLSLILPYQF
jgi:hypothetical protein